MYRNLQGYIEARTARFLREELSPEQLRKLYCDKRRSVPEIARSSGTPKHVLYERMRKWGIPRRGYRETSDLFYSKIKPQFQLKVRLSVAEEKLKQAGLILYWAEGRKRGHTVDLANSDPRAIALFLQFLRKICGIAESRLRIMLFVYEDQDIDEIRRYWVRLTGVPKRQFIKPYISPLRKDRARQRIMPYGVAHVRYNDAKLHRQIFSWIDQELELLLGAGTRVAKGA